jgi:hypothetical protein
MKNNQKGFGLVPVLLIVVIVAIVGFTGWYVWNTQGQEDKIATPTPTPTVAVSIAPSPSGVYVNWVKFSNTYYSFMYPNNWVQISSTQPTSVNFRSSDYSEKDVPTERGSYKEISNGYSLEMIEMASSAPNETLDKLTAQVVNDEKINGGGTHKTIIVDGNPSVWVNNEYSDTYLYAIVFVGNKRVHIQLNTKDDSSSQAVSLFENLLVSFEIK